MDELLENLREFKKEQEAGLEKEAKIIDVSYYGKVTLSKNDGDIQNERKEDLYLVKKEINRKTELEFKSNSRVIAVVDKEGQISIAPQYRELINEKEFLLQLENVMPMSLEKLEEISKKRLEKNKIKVNSKPNKEQSKEDTQKETKEAQGERKNKYIENAKDAKIDMNKKITETKTFADLVPEVKQKGIQDVRIRRTKNSKFEIIGIDSEGYETPLQTLEQTEGTNPAKDIIKVNGNGEEVREEQVTTMLKIKNGENQGKQNEGFTVKLGQYGIPEVSYYRRAMETNEYTSIPVNLENTNQKRTEKDVKEYIEKKRNTQVNDNIQRAEQRIENNEDKETQLENIDDDPYNDKIVDESEMQIRKAAKRCKISVEAFKQELEKQDGDTLEEKIENTEEEINEQFRGRNR